MGFKPYNKNRTHGQRGPSPFSLILTLVNHATLLCLIEYFTEIQADDSLLMQVHQSLYQLTQSEIFIQLQTAKNILWAWNRHQSGQKSYYKLPGQKESQYWSKKDATCSLGPFHRFFGPFLAPWSFLKSFSNNDDCNLWRLPDGICEAMVLCDLELDILHTATHLCFRLWMGRCSLCITFVLAMLFYIDSMPIRKVEKKPGLA